MSRIQTVESVDENEQHQQVDDAGLRPRRSAREPGGPGQRGMGKMPGENHAAVRHGIKKRLSEIKGGMHAHGKPQIPRALKREAPEKAGQHDARDARPGFAFVVHVPQAEDQRQQYRRGPMTETLRQRKLRVSAKGEFLVKSDQDEKDGPENRPVEQLSAVNGEGAKVIKTKRRHRADHHADLGQTEQRSLPEEFSEGAAQWQSITTKGASFEARHQPRRGKSTDECDAFPRHQELWGVG